MARAVAAALATRGRAAVRKEDRGAEQLARRYAQLLDAAAMPARHRKHVEGLALALGELAEVSPLAAEAAREHLERVAEALSEHTVASDLGPKLLATLTALGLTPAGRGVKGGTGGGVSKTVDELRQRRATRAARAGAGEH
jgi:hypothetical protein